MKSSDFDDITSITVQLTADGTAVDGKTATLNAAGDWTALFTNLPVKADGTAITYGVTVTPISGFDVNIGTSSTAENIFVLTVSVHNG